MTNQPNKPSTQDMPPLPSEIGMIVGRRVTPEGTREFFGYFENDYSSDKKQIVYTADQMRAYGQACAQWQASRAGVCVGNGDVAHMLHPGIFARLILKAAKGSKV